MGIVMEKLYDFKAFDKMEEQLEAFIQEEEEIEETGSGDAVWAFIHKQIIEIAKVILKKSKENLITCRVFADNSERCMVLKDCLIIFFKKLKLRTIFFFKTKLNS